MVDIYQGEKSGGSKRDIYEEERSGQDILTRHPEVSRALFGMTPAEAQSMGMGGLSDIKNLYNLVAKAHPLVQALRGVPPGVLKPVAPEQLEKAPSPGLAKATAALLPLAIPGGEAGAPLEAALSGAGTGALYGAATGTSPVGGALGGAAGGAIARPLISGLEKGFKGIPAVKEGLQRQISDTLGGIMDKWRGGEAPDADMNHLLFNRVARRYDEMMGHSTDLSGTAITAANAQHIHPNDSFAHLYENLKAFKPGLKLKRAGFDNELGQVVKALKGKEDQYQLAKMLGKPIKALVKEVGDFKNVKLNTFEDADRLKRDLNDKIADPTASRDKKIALRALKVKLKDIIPESMAGDPKLRDMWTQTDKLYKENAVPYKHLPGQKAYSPFMKSYLTGGENTDNFAQKYLRATPRGEFTDLTRNFLKIAPDAHSKNLALHEVFRGVANKPESFIKKYDAFSPSQKKILFGDEKGVLDQLSAAHKKNPSLFKEVPSSTRRAMMEATAPLLMAATTHYAGLPSIIPTAAATAPILGELMGRGVSGMPSARALLLKRLLEGEKPSPRLSQAGIRAGTPLGAYLGGMQ